MGQGIYTKIGYGATGIKLPVDSHGYCLELADVFGRRLADLWLHQSYEAEPYYIMVPLAVSDKFLAEWWQLECFARQVFPINDIPERILLKMDHAKKQWRLAMKAAWKRHQLKLPYGELLIVADYD